MSKHRDDFGDRMKGYENVTKNYLTRRTPVIIRLDGVAFHTFTKGFDKPFDELLWVTMTQTAQYLCREVQNCVFAYTQSDEISLVLIDYQNLNTDVWFGNNIQKITSVIASKASVYFNDTLHANAFDEFSVSTDEDRRAFLKNILNKVVFFDARCFNIPKEEVLNYFIWRQKDCQKNSVSAIAQSYFSNKELYKKSTKDRIEMINQYAEENGLYKYEDFDRVFLNGTTVFSKRGVRALDFIKKRDELNEMIGVKKDEDND